MADDASFHSCCDELQHHRQHHYQPHSTRSDPFNKENVGDFNSARSSGCCYSSDTDDEAQFLTASNSPMSLEASYSSAAAVSCFGPGGAGGDQRDLAACLAGDLERTLGGDESHQSMTDGEPGDGPIAVASSTVTAGVASSTRQLNRSGVAVGEAKTPADGDVDDDEEEIEEFPPPLASSSSVSLAGFNGRLPRQTAGDPAMAIVAARNASSAEKPADTRVSETTAAAVSICGDADNTAIAAGFLPHLIDSNSSSNSHNNVYCCYMDNDLTAHRPPTRRTRSGPMMLRQTCMYSATQELIWLQSEQQQQQHQKDNGDAARCLTLPQAAPLPPPPPPTTAQKAPTKLNRANGGESIDFPTRLRKRVRFADALGFDLASVVLIAGAAAAGSARDGDCLLSDDDLLFEFRASAMGQAASLATSDMFSGFCLTGGGDTAETSELNRGRLFATETESLSHSRSPALLSPTAIAQLSLMHQSEDTNWASIAPWDFNQLATPSRPVVLESVRFFTEPTHILELTARVLNLAPVKCVVARVTFDNWRHQSDWTLSYCQTLPDSPGEEQFRVRLQVPAGATGLELALSYSASGQVHWDNNAGRNYMYVYRMSQQAAVQSLACRNVY